MFLLGFLGNLLTSSPAGSVFFGEKHGSSKKQVASQGEGVNAGSLKTVLESQQSQTKFAVPVFSPLFLLWGEGGVKFLSKIFDQKVLNVLS